MIEISTFLKVGNDFLNIYDFEGELDDDFYVEGALELSINNITLIDKSMWDCIDQLWCYFVEGLMLISKNEEFRTNFPDQPIEVTFTPVKKHVLISVKANVQKKVFIERDIFIAYMASHAKKFLSKLITIGNANVNAYMPYIHDVDILLEKYPLIKFD
ncbi:hypothetical protein [Providencia stuartii]|uniref:Uncharacterized protein n=1 Tax=Providencia stuartii TaxID=588 RepID=A0AAJ1N1V5_PROST|nr:MULTISPECIES: hypothetical protein [Providencia]EMA3642296.1 hypothetical protein [Providencia stuartii]MBW3103284.1 hypothetical protein [Providencia stuartii]MCB5219820.1 hypothetical protein [Providencia stuartii]MDE5306048.1 hypothetical protein [Providencia stuartii]MDE8749056.1 hypothetical protein [Providencia thailandensis]